MPHFVAQRRDRIRHGGVVGHRGEGALWGRALAHAVRVNIGRSLRLVADGARVVICPGHGLKSQPCLPGPSGTDFMPAYAPGKAVLCPSVERDYRKT